MGDKITKTDKHHLCKAGKVDVSVNVNNGKVTALAVN